MIDKKTFSPSTKRGVDTYQKVIHAGIACMARAGFNNTSTNKIAKAAGVTWGTLQHQFGDKARLLEAILEFCIKELINNLEQSLTTDRELDRRIDSLVEAVWGNQQTLYSKAMLEILMGVRADDELYQRFYPTLQKLSTLYDQQWQELFGDLQLHQDTMEGIKQLTFSSLRGLNADLTLRSSDKNIQQAKQLLKQSLTLLLTAHRQDKSANS
jgi:AcrR family transcriptional regulator